MQQTCCILNGKNARFSIHFFIVIDNKKIFHTSHQSKNKSITHTTSDFLTAIIKHIYILKFNNIILSSFHLSKNSMLKNHAARAGGKFISLIANKLAYIA